MSDEQLRRLERRWRETRSADDEEAWQRERLRAGQLPGERLELAVALGDAVASRLVGAPPPPGAPRTWPALGGGAAAVRASAAGVTTRPGLRA